MRAQRAGSKIDRPTATGAVHDLDMQPQFVNLLLRKRAYEVLLTKEFEKANQPPVTTQATEVTKPRAPLHILSQPQGLNTSGAAH